MINHSTDNWSLCVGRLHGVELRIHILLPLTALVVLLAVKANLVEPALQAGPNVAAWAVLILATSVLLHELARIVTATRVGGHTSALVLGPIGGFTKLHLPVDPPAHLVTALAGPMTYLVLLVAAGCGLALTGSPLDDTQLNSTQLNSTELADTALAGNYASGNYASGNYASGNYDIFRLLLNPCSPPIGESTLVPLQTVTTAELVAQLAVWINWCLLLLSFLPVDPCAGAELLRGILWPMVGRSTATSATSRLALGAALFVALLAFWIPEKYSTGSIPTWFPLSVISIFLFFGGNRRPSMRNYDVGLAIDEFDSDDEEWLLGEWEDEDREAVLVEHLHDKQQEVIDRKRREREANEDARVDAILIRLRNTSFEQLSEEDRATLKRASRRYRQRRTEHHPDS